jgi:hypothetical protein
MKLQPTKKVHSDTMRKYGAYIYPPIPSINREIISIMKNNQAGIVSILVRTKDDITTG